MRVALWMVLLLTGIFSSNSLLCEQPPPRKVLFIMGELVAGGTEQAFISLMNGWSVPNTQVEIYLLKRGGPFEKYLRKDFPIISAQDAFARSYDAAVCFLSWGVNPQKLVVKARAKKKVQWIHTDLLGCPADTFFNHKDQCVGVDAFVCVAERAAQSARKIRPEFSDKIFTIHNVLDQEAIVKKSTEFDPAFPQDGLCNVITVGRLSPEKAIERTIRIHSRLDKEGIFFRWYVIGGGDLRGSLERQINACGLQNKFNLLGQKTNPYPYFLKSDIFVLASLFEGCSVAINEAKVFARPMLVTDVGGAREQITSEVNGLIVDNKEEAIYQGLKRLLQDKALRTKFSDSLSNFVYDLEFGQIAA